MSHARPHVHRVVAAFALLLSGLLAFGTTTSGAAPRQPSADAPTEAGTHLQLKGQTPFVAPTDTFTVKLAVTNAPEDALLAFELFSPITAPPTAVDPLDQRRNQLNEHLGGKPVKKDVFAATFAGGIPLSLFEKDAAGTITANFPIVSSAPRPEQGFLIDDPGVYPISVSLFAGDPRTVLDRFTTYLVRLPLSTATAPALQVATVMPFHAPLATKPGAIVLTPEVQSGLRSKVDLLERHPGIPLTVDPTPETVEAFVATEPRSSSDLEATNRLAKAVSGRDVLSSTFVDLDLNAWVESDMMTQLDRQLTRGSRTLNEQLHLDPSADRRTWIASEPVSPQSLARLREFGIEQIVFPDTLVAPFDPRVLSSVQAQIASAQPFDVENQAGGRLRAAAADGRLAGRFTATANPALNAQLAITDLALIYFNASENPTTLPATPRGVVLQVPENPAALPALDSFLAAIATQSAADGGAKAAFTPVTLDSIFQIPPATVPRSTTPLVRGYTTPAERASMGEYPERLATIDRRMVGYQSMTENGSPERVPALQRMLDVSGAAELTPEARMSYLAGVDVHINEAVGGVSAPAQEQITLTDVEAPLSLQFENSLTYPVDVLVVLEAEKLRFPDGSSIVATLQPGSNRIPVRVRAPTSGSITVDMATSSPDGSLPLTTSHFVIRSTFVSDLGRILTISAGFFLMLWWGKNFRNTRRARKLVATDSPSENGSQTDASFEDSVPVA